MSDKIELDETMLESELDKTLDATVADDSDIGATIKATVSAELQNLNSMTVVDNSDNSQTITLEKQSFSYEQQTVFDGSVANTVMQDDVEKTILMPVQDNNITLAESEVTLVDQNADNTVVMPRDEDSKTVIGETAAASGNLFGSNDSASRSGSSVSFGGGSVSVNVRPRNVAATVSDDAEGSSERKSESVDVADFELIKKLGEGGMGVVYSARQSSIDRAIALKMIKNNVVSEEAKSKFLVEAVVTGDLDHPNIVPVYDLGVDASGSIFYAMKQVVGVEWSKALPEKNKSENIEILLRVCDAIAFAHDRGVIHRDLKPENVMLGPFGEVLVMDWGLALAINDTAKAESVGPDLGIAGTPAYLAPEMARGDAWNMLGCCSDIYLLGAILFEIVTGKRPHTGKNIRKCLLNAAKNIIREVEVSGELIDIAYKAMATNPADRYQSVQELQNAIRNYLAHSESINLAAKAESDLAIAEKTGVYDDYAKALFGFRQAVELWEENTVAGQGEVNAGVKYATAALNRGDLDLGLSLVTAANEFSEVKGKLLTAKKDRERHVRRLKLLTRGVAILGVVIIIISTGAALWIQRERAVAVEQREEAIKQEIIAVEQREIAVAQEQIAITERHEAQKQTLLARAETERANEQTVVANEQRLEAKKQEAIAKEQRALALEEKALAEAETLRANKQTVIANKAKALAQNEKIKAQKSEEKALSAIEKMVTAQTEEQLERAKREAAELTAKTTQEELSSRDQLKENTWWVFDAEQARSMQQKAADNNNLPVSKVVTVNGEAIDFKLIPAGKFGMGSKINEVGRGSEEVLHRVEISKPFYVSKTELTFKQWLAITGVKDSAEGDYPAWNVSYTELKRDILPVIQTQLPNGWKVRIPTEAEWEWAARAGTNTPYYSGSSQENLKEIGYTGVELLTSAKAVAQLAPNAWGLYDMIGNLAEWCEDVYVRDGYISEQRVVRDPVVTTGGKHYVVRGGAWSNLPEHCRAGYRSYANKDSKYNFLGVRLVLVPPVK